MRLLSFDGATIRRDYWISGQTKAGIASNTVQTYLCDGGTGEQFDQAATVGVTYMLEVGPHG